MKRSIPTARNVSQRKYRYQAAKKRSQSLAGGRPFAGKGDSRDNSRLFWAIMLLAAVLRLFRLGAYPFWHDEVHNLIKASHIGEVLFRGEYVSNHPPLFPILASGWRVLAIGDPEWFMRGLPALLGVLTVAAVYWAGRTLFNHDAGLFAAFLTAISPFFITHSQDFKEYMVLPLTGTLAAVALYQAATTNRADWWMGYAICAALACYSESCGGALLMGGNLWFIFQARGRWHTLPGWIVSNVAAVALFAPFLPFLLRRADKMLVESETWWVPEPTPLSIVFYVKTLAFGYSALEPNFKVALALYVLCFVAGLAIAVRKFGRAASFAVCWFAVPVALVYVLSLLVESVFLYRAMLPFAVPFYLLIGVAWARLDFPWTRLSLPRPRLNFSWARFGMTAVFVAATAPGLWQYYYRVLSPAQFPHRPGIHAPQDFEAAAEHIQEQWRPGDGVVTAAMNAWLTVRWYGLKDYPVYFGAVDHEFIDNIVAGNPRTSDDPEYDTLYPRDIGTVVKDMDRVWFVYAEWERTYLEGNATQVWRWLDVRYPEKGRWPFLGGELRLFDTSVPPGSVVPVRRQRDNGAVAVIERAGETEPYRLVTPDSDVVARPDAERRGRLNLSLGGDAWVERRNAAQSDTTRLVTFTLMNNSDASAVCDVGAVACDTLVTAASLTKREPDSEVWRTMSQHNPGGAPTNYELPVAVAQFSAPGSASIEGAVNLIPGTYDTAVYMLGTPGDTTYARADVRIELGGVSLLPDVPGASGTPLRWAWLRGEPVTVSVTSAPLTVTVTHTPGLDSSHADVGYVAFLRRRESRRGRPGAGALLFEAWPGRITLAPRSSRTWTLEVDEDLARVDVWAWDRSADGMVYRIFDASGASASAAEQ